MKLRPVAASTGLLWVKLGMKTFLRQPLAMTGLFFMFIAAVSVVSVFPLIGTPLALALLPPATLGLMAATRDAANGKFPMPVVLVSGLRGNKERRNAMVQLGAIYAVGFLLVMGASALFDGGAFAQMYLGGSQITAETVQDPAFQQAMWVGMGLYLPLALVFWHAPALVHWHGISPVKSLFFSALACWQNKGAMLVYMLGWIGMFLIAALLVTLLASVVGSPEVASLAVFPAILFMASMFFTSIYFTFRDSFDDDAAALDAPGLPDRSSGPD